MVSLWRSSFIKNIYKPGKFLINGRLILTNYQFKKSDKTDNSCRPTLPPCCPPEPPQCCPTEPPSCCPPEPPVCCPQEPPICCDPQNEQGKIGKPIVKTKKQYTLVMDLAKKGCEIIQLIGNSNEYDFAKEQIKKAITLSFGLVKQCSTMLQKNVSEQFGKIKAKGAKQTPKKK